MDSHVTQATILVKNACRSSEIYPLLCPYNVTCATPYHVGYTLAIYNETMVNIDRGSYYSNLSHNNQISNIYIYICMLVGISHIICFTFISHMHVDC